MNLFDFILDFESDKSLFWVITSKQGMLIYFGYHPEYLSKIFTHREVLHHVEIEETYQTIIQTTIDVDY